MIMKVNKMLNQICILCSYTQTQNKATMDNIKNIFSKTKHQTEQKNHYMLMEMKEKSLENKVPKPNCIYVYYFLCWFNKKETHKNINNRGN